MDPRESVDNKHWVEELFPPAFGFTVDEILSDIGNDKTDTEQSVFDQYARGVHPLDTSAIKNVYQRVWLMTEIEKQEKEKKKLEKEFVGDLKSAKTATSGVEVRDAETSTDDLEQTPKHDIHDPCIWSDSEIQVLREVFQTARHQNQDLAVQLAEITDRYNTLYEKHKLQTKELDTKTTQLNDALKANSRIHILSENLHTQLRKAKADVLVWKKEVEILKEERQSYMDQLHENNLRYNQERLEKTKLTSDLEKHSKKSLRDQILREEKLKVTHSQELSAVRKKLARVEEELEQARMAHERDKRGLEHLRTHFASLPYAEEERKKQGMVTEDQIKTWTY